MNHRPNHWLFCAAYKVLTPSSTMEMEVVTPALRWVASRGVSQTTHAIINDRLMTALSWKATVRPYMPSSLTDSWKLCAERWQSDHTCHHRWQIHDSFVLRGDSQTIHAIIADRFMKALYWEATVRPYMPSSLTGSWELCLERWQSAYTCLHHWQVHESFVLRGDSQPAHAIITDRFMRALSWEVTVRPPVWECSSVSRASTSTPLTKVWFPVWKGIFLPQSTFSADSLTVSVHPHVQSHPLATVHMLKILSPSQSLVDYGNTKTPSMHCRLGRATLLQLTFPGKCNPNFPWGKFQWDNPFVNHSQIKRAGYKQCTVEWTAQAGMWQCSTSTFEGFFDCPGSASQGK